MVSMKKEKSGQTWLDKIQNKKTIIMEQIKQNPPSFLKEQKHPNGMNREIVLIAYLFAGLFLCMGLYFTYFLSIKSENVVNSTYNAKRQDLLANRVDRGPILAKNGEVLAKSEIDSEGNTTRVYPYDNLFVHVVGRFENGKTGLELTENFNLLTSNTNPILKIMNELSGKKNPGDAIATTLDVNLQKVAYDALGSHKGAIVVLEPSTGKILAMVSKPDYNPNTILSNWDSLVEDSDNNSTLLNRATQGLYPPGSTFKILTALEYMRESKDYKKYSYSCVGTEQFGDITINCYNGAIHGEEDLEEAFIHSCNTFFATIGTKLNPASFQQLCESMSFNKELPLKMVYNPSSFVLNKKSDTMERVQTAIGQGKTQITPFHNALIAASIANGGVLMKPYLVDHIENENGDIIKKIVPQVYDTWLTTKEAELLKNYMAGVVEKGTATSLKTSAYQAAGKTGSAEYDSNKSSHAWFVGFAPSDQPQLAVSIIVEGAGTGGAYAVPIAKKIFDAYLK